MDKDKLLQDSELAPLDNDELRRRMLRHKGKRAFYRPLPGDEKSTTVRVWDIAVLCDIDHMTLYKYLRCKISFGEKRRIRLSRIIRLLDAGMITKSQYGVYQIHDKPVVKPTTELKVSISLDKGVSIAKGNKESTPSVMPDFSKIFGG